MLLPPRLTSLNLEHYVVSELEKNIFLAPVFTKDLRKLALVVLQSARLHEMGELLHEADQTLEELDIKLSLTLERQLKNDVGTVLSPLFKLSTLTKLVKLNLHHPTGILAFYFLDRLPRPELLQQLLFTVSFGTLSGFTNRKYQRLDEYCADGGKFSGLHEVRFLYMGPLGYDAAKKELENAFLKINKRGILGVDMVG